ncbi:hypothetical protein [Rhodoferax sp. BLA1]|uniref:hypothetical protein n=1 Tax=Rhodoferax sp. BLA1 TaxID=2576062 RepID=UPI0015D3F3B3|nr:hypothetical protein [Rhodoferax sp. BLA1]
MIFKNISRWIVTPEIEGLLFFAQRMNELLFDYTFDTFKPSALNAPFLAKEAVSLISDIESGIIDVANLEPVLQELEWAIQNDSISKKLLDARVEYYILKSDETKLTEVKLRLEVLSKTLEPYRYLQVCTDALHDAIDKKSKKSIDALSRNVVTTLINIGLSKQHLYEATQDFFFKPEGDLIKSTECYKKFIDSILPVTHSFDLFFIASNLINEISDSISSMDADIIENLPSEASDIAKKCGFSKDENEVYVHIRDIRSYDKYSARDEAIRTLENLSNLFTVFHHKAKVTWKPAALATQCCAPGIVLVNPPKSAMDKVADMRPSKASKELNRLIDNLPLNKASSTRLMRVADLHGICVSHAISENQLVNIWTALETLIPSNLGSSKISNITSAMLPFLMKAYIGRIVERFTFDLMRWDQWRAKKILRKVPSQPGSNLVARAANLLTIKENETLRQELYAALSDFHLLRYRAYSLSASLCEPKNIKTLLETHEKKLAWQLRRIYRTRNLIVHSGRYPSYLTTLIENGHEYLDQIIFDLIKMTCGEYRTETLEQAFEIAKILRIKFDKNLTEVQNFTIDNNKFLIDKGPIIYV